MSTAGWATHHKLSKTEERVCRLIAPAPEPGPGPQGGLPPGEVHRLRSREHGWAHAKIKRISMEKNELLAEFLFGDAVQRVEPREIWVRQLISPLVEFPGHVVGRQRAAMGVEQEDQLHQDRRGVGLLGSKVEHRHDVALIVTAHRESEVREDHVTEEERAQHFQSRNPPLRIPILECPRVLFRVDLLVEPVHLLLFWLHFIGAPSSHKCQSFVRGASIAATPPRGLRQVRGVLDKGLVEEEPQHERQHPDHLAGFPHRGGGHLPGPKWLKH